MFQRNERDLWAIIDNSGYGQTSTTEYGMPLDLKVYAEIDTKPQKFYIVMSLVLAILNFLMLIGILIVSLMYRHNKKQIVEYLKILERSHNVPSGDSLLSFSTNIRTEVENDKIQE